MSMHETIRTRIAELLAASDSELEWVKPAVRAHTFLPLYVGWVASLGIRPDGSFIRWDHDDDRDSVTPLSDAYWQRMAICQGVKKYPELRALLPERPTTALTCEACGGSGQLNAASPVVCRCGGVGWIIPGEQPEPFPG
jgi:hypothetical protein